jgi:hypothetical protein
MNNSMVQVIKQYLALVVYSVTVHIHIRHKNNGGTLDEDLR